MSIKKLLVPLDDGVTGRLALSTAYQVAVTNSAHIEAYHVAADAKEAVPLLGEGMSGAMIEEMIDLADKDADERAKAAREAFNKFCKENQIAIAERGPSEYGVTASWNEAVGREDQLVAYRGRVADLIVVAKPPVDIERPVIVTLHSAVFESGKPVLLAPPTTPEVVGERVAIAWTGSAYAARAVTAAMPILEGAEQVLIYAVDTVNSPVRLPATDLAEQLSWHGVSAEIRDMRGGAGTTGTALLDQCAADNVSLLVMGAFTQSRMAQIVLGSVTRHVIQNTHVPVLMAH